MTVLPQPRPGSPAEVGPAQYRVGDLLIDTGRQRLTRDGQAIALPKLSYDLLLVLVRGAPNLVSLEALMEQVWPRAVVSPETVSQRVKLLRDALGDDPRSPRYVEGLRGRGYRLIPAIYRVTPGTAVVAASPASGVAVEAAVVAAAPARPVPPDRPGHGRSLRRWTRPTFISLIGAVAIAAVIAIALHERKPAQPARTSVEVAAVAPHTVAVLPFENLSAQPDNEYLALGIADSVLHELASSPDLIVIARSSSFRLNTPASEPGEIGRRLGAHFLVSGSVQRAGDMLRVTARLVDASTRVELWSLKLDRAMGDVFALQDQIAQRVAQQLDATVRSKSVDYARFGTDAWLAFLRGRALIESRRVNDVEASIQQFSRAVELAPTFAAALAELARAKGELEGLSGADSGTSPEVDAMITRAIQIDPGAGEPYFMRASRRVELGNLPGAEADYRRGLELAPNFGPGIRSYAEYLAGRKRYDEALEQIDRARLVEPLSAENHYRKGEFLRLLAMFHLFDPGAAPGHERQQLDEAAALYLQALAVQPQFYPAYTRLAQTRWQQGRLAEAVKYAEKSVALEPAASWTRWRLVWFYVELGDLPAARDVLRRYEPGARAMQASEALLCYRAGNLARTEVLLRATGREAGADNDGYSWAIAPQALIERAIASHDAARARQFIVTLPGLKRTQGAPEVIDENFPWIMQLAELEHSAGNPAVARGLARRILQYLDSRDGQREIAGGGDEWARASASAILGRSDAALAHLENLIGSGQQSQPLQPTLAASRVAMGGLAWWARIERDPDFASLRSTPRFQAIISALRLWQQDQLRQLALLRARGEVPIRAPQQLSPQGC
ncbi:MAG: winged helix-turn-helix domain-containing protein [Proteobacteria bacterium]|nr:winged helix-turn-helix domain-containing protein [Pseudomonadota bacterium]